MKPKSLYYVLTSSLSLLIVAAAVLFYFGNQRLSRQVTKLRRLQSDIILEKEKTANLAKLDQQYKTIKPLADKVNTALPAEKQQAEVIAQLTSIVQSTGLGLSGISFESTKGLPSETSQTKQGSVSGTLIMPVTFQTTGSYGQLISLLTKLEQQLRYMQVSKLEIVRVANEQVVAFTINLDIYLKP